MEPERTPGADFVVQAPSVAPSVLARLARTADAGALIPFGNGSPAAYRLPGVAGPPELLDQARTAGLDGAFVPRARRRNDVRVVAMDMDSTLITIECIDEIADMLHLKPQVAAITVSAMRGEIDFAQSLIRRVALLEGLPVEALARVYDERLVLSPGAEAMLAGFRAAGAKTALLSGGFTFFTDRLKARLGLDRTVANTLEVIDGRLSGRVIAPIVDAAAKARALRELRQSVAADGGLVVAIGDGANDLPMFAEADVSIAYRAKPAVRAAATHALDACGLDAVLNLFN